MAFQNFFSLFESVLSDAHPITHTLSYNDLHNIELFHFNLAAKSFAMVIEGQNETFCPCDIIISVSTLNASSHAIKLWVISEHFLPSTLTMMSHGQKVWFWPSITIVKLWAPKLKWNSSISCRSLYDKVCSMGWASLRIDSKREVKFWKAIVHY